jgi:1,4-alpha-glucan branching enzyme
LGKDAHGSAGFGVNLWFAPGTGYGKAQAMQDFDDQINADG